MRLPHRAGWRVLAVLLGLCSGAGVAWAVTSQLWGTSGELYVVGGRLPDFSFAGYHQSNDPLPTITTTTNVKTTYGAVGNGVADDTNAFQAAAAAGGKIAVPAGTYKITEIITITHSGTVFKGAGVGTSILSFPKSLADVYGYRENTAHQSVYSYGNPSFIQFTNVSESALEAMTIQFPSTTYNCPSWAGDFNSGCPSHHKERGYNAVRMAGVTNSWLRDITFINSDFGVLLENASYNTLTGLTFPAGRGGHTRIWLQLTSHHNLIEDFTIAAASIHQLTLQINTYLNVFRNGSMVTPRFDHHSCCSNALQVAPYKNLYSNITVSGTSGIWNSGGYTDSHHAGPQETFWNVRLTGGAALNTIPGFGYSSRGPIAPQVNMIGFAFSQFNRSGANEWVEGITPAALVPQELFAAQLARRGGDVIQPPPPPPPPAVPRNLRVSIAQ